MARRTKDVQKYKLIGAILLTPFFFIGLYFAFTSFFTTIAPTGTLYLSLRPEPANQNPISIYSLDFKTATLQNLAGDNGDYLTNKYSPDGTKIVYGTYLYNAPKLYVVNSDFSNKVEVPLPPNISIAHSASWSPDGTILAYQTKTDTDGNDLNPEEWQIYLTNLQTGTYKFVTTGVSPIFTPDGNLLVLKETGLYLFFLDDLAAGAPNEGLEGERIIDLEDGGGLANMKLGISPQGDKLAWSVPDRGILYLFTVKSWDTFDASLKKTAATTGFWPIFSPDGKYIALEEVETNLAGVFVFPSIAVFDANTLHKKTILSLQNYSTDSLFITDWRY